jgi:hypothetical protein
LINGDEQLLDATNEEEFFKKKKKQGGREKPVCLSYQKGTRKSAFSNRPLMVWASGI